MKLWQIALVLFSIGVAENAVSASAYRFDLVENGQIRGTCQGPDGAEERSRLKVVIDGSMGTYRQVKLKAYLCTASYGFREAKIFINAPEQLFRAQALSGLAVGASQSFSGIPSTKTPGKLLTIDLAKLGPASPIIGWPPYAKYQLSWPVVPAGNNEYAPFAVFLDSPRNMGDVVGFRDGFHQPWRVISISYKHPQVGQPFVMTGMLRELSEE